MEEAVSLRPRPHQETGISPVSSASESAAVKNGVFRTEVGLLEREQMGF